MRNSAGGPGGRGGNFFRLGLIVHTIAHRTNALKGGKKPSILFDWVSLIDTCYLYSIYAIFSPDTSISIVVQIICVFGRTWSYVTGNERQS
jgi:hypothetical protein